MALSGAEFTRIGASISAVGIRLSITAKDVDTTTPVLSLATGTKTGSTTATGTVSTDESGGTLYFWATENATQTAAEIKASGDSQAVVATGVQNVSFTGLTAGTTYYAHYVQDDAASNESNVVTSVTFKTDVADTTAGGWVPPKRVTRKIKKKDTEILESIYELIAAVEEVPGHTKLVQRAKKVETKVKKAIKLKDFTEQDKQIKQTKAQITRLESAIKTHIRKEAEDEDQAIKLLMDIM